MGIAEWVVLVFVLGIFVTVMAALFLNVEDPKEESNEESFEIDLTLMGKEDYDFLVRNDWKPTPEAQRHFYPPHIVRRRLDLAREQQRGIAQQKLMLEEAKQRRLVEQMISDGRYYPLPLRK